CGRCQSTTSASASSSTASGVILPLSIRAGSVTRSRLVHNSRVSPERLVMSDFDALIIGTGQAGPPLAFRLAGAGMKVAVVERHLVGGTCVNTGCTPTKALVASAYAARIARRAAEYGVVIGGDLGIDMPRVKARMDAIVAASRNGLTSGLENAANITLYRGHARFASPQAVESG